MPLELKFLPLGRDMEDVPAAFLTLLGSRKPVVVTHEYKCTDGSLTPTPEVSRVSARAVVVMSDRTPLPLSKFMSSFKKHEALRQLFYGKIVKRDEAAYQKALEQAFGVYHMDIAARAALLPKYVDQMAWLRSAIDYAYFRVVWPGVRKEQWVLLCLPIGETHSISSYEECGELEETVPLPDGKVEKNKVILSKSYQPKTKRARVLQITYRKARARIVKRKIAALEQQLEGHEKAVEDLSQE